MNDDEHLKTGAKLDSVNPSQGNSYNGIERNLCTNCGYTLKLNSTKETARIFDLIEQINSLKREIYELKSANNSELDATDFAHPAWWRGQDDGVFKSVSAFHSWLEEDYIKAGSYQYRPMQEARDKIIAIINENCALLKTVSLLLDGKSKWLSQGSNHMKNHMIEFLRNKMKSEEFIELFQHLEPAVLDDKRPNTVDISD